MPLPPYMEPHCKGPTPADMWPHCTAPPPHSHDMEPRCTEPCKVVAVRYSPELRILIPVGKVWTTHCHWFASRLHQLWCRYRTTRYVTPDLNSSTFYDAVKPLFCTVLNHCNFNFKLTWIFVDRRGKGFRTVLCTWCICADCSVYWALLADNLSNDVVCISCRFSTMTEQFYHIKFNEWTGWQWWCYQKQTDLLEDITPFWRATNTPPFDFW